MYSTLHTITHLYLAPKSYRTSWLHKAESRWSTSQRLASKGHSVPFHTRFCNPSQYIICHENRTGVCRDRMRGLWEACLVHFHPGSPAQGLWRKCPPVMDLSIDQKPGQWPVSRWISPSWLCHTDSYSTMYRFTGSSETIINSWQQVFISWSFPRFPMLASAMVTCHYLSLSYSLLPCNYNNHPSLREDFLLECPDSPSARTFKQKGQPFICHSIP